MAFPQLLMLYYYTFIFVTGDSRCHKTQGPQADLCNLILMPKHDHLFVHQQI